MALNKALTFPLLALLVNGCGAASSRADIAEPDGGFASSGYATRAEPREEREPFDEDAARDRAREEVRSEGYSGACTIDCSGHDAGFDWAADGNADGGLSSSQSFDEGQEAYERAVDERVEEVRQSYEDGEAVDY